MATQTAFLSYSHDSEQHIAAAIALADRLSREGVPTSLDKYQDSPIEGWPKWMEKQIRDATFILVVCTRQYKDKYEGTAKPGEGKGVKWESLLAVQRLYDADSLNKILVPLLFSDSDASDIIAPFAPFTRYRPYVTIDPEPVWNEEEYTALYRLLTKQPEYIQPTPGPIRLLPATNLPALVHSPKESATVPLPCRSIFNEIARENLLDSIDDQVRSGIHALLVEGESGDGKSILIGAYARRHAKRAICVVVSAASKWGYDPHCVLQLIGLEIHRVLGLPAPSADHVFQEQDLQSLYVRLGRRGTASEPILFILDGLHEIPVDDDHIRRRVLDMIPLGMSGISAILTDSVPSRLTLTASARSKAWRLTRFSLDESKEYLKDVVHDAKLIGELHQVFKGRPGSLAVVHRLLSAGQTPQQLLANADGELVSLLEREWASLGVLSETQLRMLGLQVFARTAMTAADIARVLKQKVGDVRSLLARIPFIQTDAVSEAVSIVGDTMRQFVARKTERYRKGLLDALILDLQTNPTSRQSLADLPRYFQDAGRLEELVSYLTPTRLSESLRNAESLRPLSDSLNAGLDASTKLKRDGDSYRFSLQTSTIAEIGAASNWDPLVGAVLALKDFGQAVQIAESVPLAREKLLLLASVAAAQRRDGLSPPEDLTNRIRRILDDVSDSLGPEQAVELAGRLFAVMPDRATQLVQRAASEGRPGGTVDRAIAGLTIYATLARNAAAETGGSHSDFGAVMRAHIRDPELRRFSTNVSASMCSVSAADALAQSNSIENARDRIFFLRHWTAQNKHRADAIDVTQVAIDLIVATTEYSPNARDVLRISLPLRLCADEKKAMRCVSRLGALLGDLAARGPTAELFRLRILLASTTYRWNREDGRTRFQEEYFAIGDIPDLAIRAECLARLASQLSLADPDGYLQTVDQLHDLVNRDTRECVESLLACTADHVEMLSPVISALANSHPQLAEEFLQCANILTRREALRLHAIERMFRGSASRTVMEAAVRIVRQAETSSGRNECAIALWREIEATPQVLEIAPDLVDSLASVAFGGNDARDRSVCAALAYSAVRRAQLQDQEKLLTRLKDLLRRSLCEIDDTWEAIDTSLESCTLLAKADVELARECLSKAQEIQRERLEGRSGPTWLVAAPIKLALASLAGLMRKACDQTSDSERLLSLIACLPSAALRAQFRAELAVWYYAANRLDDCRRIVQIHLLPEIRTFEGRSDSLLGRCVMAAADAIFVSSPETARTLFAKLEREERDVAIIRAVTAKLNRLPASEPYRDDDKRTVRFSREDIEEIIGLLRLADADSTSWGIVERITTAIAGAGSTVFSSQQLGSIAQQLDAVAAEILPRKDWIQHRGYAVLWSAASRRIKGKKLEFGDPAIVEARKIVNTSDRCFMLAYLSGVVNSDAGARLLDEAAALARQVPIEVERIDRLAYVAVASMRLKGTSGSSLAKEVCKLAQSCDHGDMDDVRRRVMDAVYRSNRELAGALAEAGDTDPARIDARAKRGRAQLQERLRELDAGKAVMDHSGQESLPPADIERLPAATWQALASLNAGRSQAKRIEDLRPYIRIASALPLSEAYPIMAWILANARLRFETTDQAATILRPFFEACSMVAEFSTATAFPTHALRLPTGSESEDPLLVRIGQQNEVREIFDRWIAENVKTQLLICDPYFGPDDLWVLSSVLRHAPSASVVILTSREKFPHGMAAAEEQFRSRWSELSDQEPPNTEVVVCGFADSGKLPVHDRWWLADAAGMRPGTSLGGLGLRESRLNTVEEGEMAADRAMIEEYSKRHVRKAANGKAIQYSIFVL